MHWAQCHTWACRTLGQGRGSGLSPSVGRAAGADDGGELMVDRGEERGPGIAHQRHHTLGTGIHQGQHIVGRLDRQEAAPHGRRVEHLGSATDRLHDQAD